MTATTSLEVERLDKGCCGAGKHEIESLQAEQKSHLLLRSLPACIEPDRRVHTSLTPRIDGQIVLDLHRGSEIHLPGLIALLGAVGFGKCGLYPPQERHGW
jgi:hypothetical protein